MNKPKNRTAKRVLRSARLTNINDAIDLIRAADFLLEDEHHYAGHQIVRLAYRPLYDLLGEEVDL